MAFSPYETSEDRGEPFELYEFVYGDKYVSTSPVFTTRDSENLLYAMNSLTFEEMDIVNVDTQIWQSTYLHSYGVCLAKKDSPLTPIWNDYATYTLRYQFDVSDGGKYTLFGGGDNYGTVTIDNGQTYSLPRDGGNDASFEIILSEGPHTVDLQIQNDEVYGLYTIPVLTSRDTQYITSMTNDVMSGPFFPISVSTEAWGNCSLVPYGVALGQNETDPVLNNYDYFYITYQIQLPKGHYLMAASVDNVGYISVNGGDLNYIPGFGTDTKFEFDASETVTTIVVKIKNDDTGTPMETWWDNPWGFGFSVFRSGWEWNPMGIGISINKTGEAVYRYTNADHNLTRNGVEWTAIPISRQAYKSSGKSKSIGLEITVPVIADISNLFTSFPPPDVVKVTILQGHLNDPEEEVMSAWVGRVLSTAKKGRETSLSCESILSSMQRPGLRRNWQVACPYQLYGEMCNADMEAAVTRATVVSMSGNTILFQAGWNGDIPFSKYGGGMLRWAGDMGTEYRMILNIDDSGQMTYVGPIRALAEGTAVDIILGCGHSIDDCRNLHNNIQNYGGDAWIPLVNPTKNQPYW